MFNEYSLSISQRPCIFLTDWEASTNLSKLLSSEASSFIYKVDKSLHNRQNLKDW